MKFLGRKELPLSMIVDRWSILKKKANLGHDTNISNSEAGEIIILFIRCYTLSHMNCDIERSVLATLTKYVEDLEQRHGTPNTKKCSKSITRLESLSSNPAIIENPNILKTKGSGKNARRSCKCDPHFKISREHLCPKSRKCRKCRRSGAIARTVALQCDTH